MNPQPPKYWIMVFVFGPDWRLLLAALSDTWPSS
jgi:hypothetical protein